MLSPNSPHPTSNPVIHLRVTISGNAVNISENPQAESTAESTSNVQPTENLTLASENPQDTSAIAEQEDPDLQDQAERRLAEAFARAAKVNPKLASRLDLLSDDRVGAATDVVKGLASMAWNLQKIVKIGDLLAEVSPSSWLLYMELIQLNSCW